MDDRVISVFHGWVLPAQTIMVRTQCCFFHTVDAPVLEKLVLANVFAPCVTDVLIQALASPHLVSM